MLVTGKIRKPQSVQAAMLAAWDAAVDAAIARGDVERLNQLLEIAELKGKPCKQ